MPELVTRLRELAQLVAGPMSAEELASGLGVVTRRSSGDIEVMPAEPGFDRAVVVLSATAPGGLAHVDLTLEAPATESELVAAFGDVATGWEHHRRDRFGVIRLPMPGEMHAVTLIVGFKGDAVVDITLRRDVRLEEPGA